MPGKSCWQQERLHRLFWPTHVPAKSFQPCLFPEPCEHTGGDTFLQVPKMQDCGWQLHLWKGLPCTESSMCWCLCHFIPLRFKLLQERTTYKCGHVQPLFVSSIGCHFRPKESHSNLCLNTQATLFFSVSVSKTQNTELQKNKYYRN